MGKGAKVSPGEMAAEELGGGNFLERGFESLGAWVGDGGCRSWVVTIVTLVVMMGACSGFSVLETENRPEKQWVPDGAIALEEGLKSHTTAAVMLLLLVVVSRHTSSIRRRFSGVSLWQALARGGYAKPRDQ